MGAERPLAATPLFIGCFNPGSDGTGSLMSNLFSPSMGNGKAQGGWVRGWVHPETPVCILLPKGKAGDGSGGETGSDALQHHIVLLQPALVEAVPARWN